jgi:general secretion pathway protein D
MKKLLILIILVFSILIKADEIEEVDSLPLKEYISMISNDLDMTIVLSDDIQENFTLMVPHDSGLTNSDYLKILVQILKKNDLMIEPFKSFFLISKNKKDDEQNKELNFIVLNNVDYETIKPLFNTIKDINHSYISSNKTIAFNSTKKQYIRLSKLIQQLDKVPNQLKLKVTIVDTNLDKLKDYGTELKQISTFTSSHNLFFNLLAYPFTVNSEVSKIKSSQLHSFIKFMDTNKLSKIKSATTLSLFDNRLTRFDIVDNIPYKTGETTTKDGNTSSISQTSYKDVGLKLRILPRIYSNNTYLDIKLTSEKLTENSETPTTSKNYIEQTITMKKDKIFVLTGINQNRSYYTLNSTPFLSEVPFLGWLFKTDNKNKITSNLTIFLELIGSEDIYLKEKETIIHLPDLNHKVIELTSQQKYHKRVNEILGIN